MADSFKETCQKQVDSFLKKRLGWLPARIALGVIAWFGFLNVYMVRVNLSMAIIAMAKRNISGGRDAVCVAGLQENVNGTSALDLSSDEGKASDLSSRTEYEEGEFSWDETTQGLVLGSFFYGHVFSQILGGRVAEIYGTKIVFGTVLLSGGICSLLSPVMARWHYGALIALRAIQGFLQGPSWPSMTTCISRWIPPIERPMFIAVVNLAATLSSAIAMPLCGVIIANHGWDAQFYVMGCLSLVWGCFWFSFVYDSPEEHPRISVEERDYIQSVLMESGTKKSTSKRVPWKEIFTSIHVWAAFMYSFGNSWSLALFFTQLPTYMRNVLGFSIKSNGALSAVPFLCRYLGGILWSTLGSYLISQKYLSITNTRRVFAVVGLIVPALMVLGVSFSGCDAVATITLLCVALFCNGAGAVSGFVSHNDMAPNFAGTLLGCSNTIPTAQSFVVPLLTGVITQGQQTLEAWQKVFWICIPIYIIPAIFYVIFVSGEVQPWNDVDSLESKSSMETQRLKENQEDDDYRKHMSALEIPKLEENQGVVDSWNHKSSLETQRLEENQRDIDSWKHKSMMETQRLENRDDNFYKHKSSLETQKLKENEGDIDSNKHESSLETQTLKIVQEGIYFGRHRPSLDTERLEVQGDDLLNRKFRSASLQPSIRSYSSLDSSPGTM